MLNNKKINKMKSESANINTLKSEVELNQKLIFVGDILIYCDACNCERWQVTELFDGGFEAKNDYETKDFWFNELQYGWSISEKTKKEHTIYNKIHYAA